MNILMEKNSIVSATEVVKNFSKVRQQAKEGSNMIVFKNNKPDLAILDIDQYEDLLKMAEELENLKISQLIQERYNNDDGTRYTTEDILEMRRQKKKR